MTKTPQTYPGESATAGQVFGLAEEYRLAALSLVPLRRPGEPLSLAPCRFLAIHAIELYLNALLLRADIKPSAIRAMMHDFSARTALAIENGLVLRKRTAEHLTVIAQNREHQVSRYGAEAIITPTQINRLMATLDELAMKVAAKVKISQ